MSRGKPSKTPGGAPYRDGDYQDGLRLNEYRRGGILRSGYGRRGLIRPAAPEEPTLEDNHVTGRDCNVIIEEWVL